MNDCDLLDQLIRGILRVLDEFQAGNESDLKGNMKWDGTRGESELPWV